MTCPFDYIECRSYYEKQSRQADIIEILSLIPESRAVLRKELFL